MSTVFSAPTVRPIPAQGNALDASTTTRQALKGRPKGVVRRTGLAGVWPALSRLPSFSLALPKGLPWVGMVCSCGAREPSAARVDGHLKKREAVWK